MEKKLFKWLIICNSPHLLRIEQYRKINKNPEGRIGIILNLTPSYPAAEKIEDLKAAEMADLWQNRLF